jgi:NAD(P)-dependent dehydrogenase (short-subunit alcohol dehydrogenase family)
VGEDRAAIVTGASSGIGLAVARALIEDGYGVALAARRAERLEELAQELGERALAVPTDVSDRGQVQELVERTAERFGRIDVAVTAAGVLREAPLEQIGEAEWEETMGINLKGTYLVAQAVLPHLRAGRGYLITISSVSGTFGQAGGTAYNASKWAVRGFTQSVLQEVRGDGVRATAICPARVATPMLGFEKQDPDLLSPEDVADAVRWLLSLRPIVQIKDLILERTTA